MLFLESLKEPSLEALTVAIVKLRELTRPQNRLHRLLFWHLMFLLVLRVGALHARINEHKLIVETRTSPLVYILII